MSNATENEIEDKLRNLFYGESEIKQMPQRKKAMAYAFNYHIRVAVEVNRMIEDRDICIICELPLNKCTCNEEKSYE